jgi:hypothetical protein
MNCVHTIQFPFRLINLRGYVALISFIVVTYSLCTLMSLHLCLTFFSRPHTYSIPYYYYYYYYCHGVCFLFCLFVVVAVVVVVVVVVVFCYCISISFITFITIFRI